MIGPGMPMDILIVPERKWLELKDESGLIFKEAVKRGKVLYESRGNLAKLLAPAEREVQSSQTRPARDFLKEFKRAKKIED